MDAIFLSRWAKGRFIEALTPPMRHLSPFCLLIFLVGKTAAIASDTRPLVKHWVVEDFDAVIFVGLEGYRDFENGRNRFSDATCASCHRIGERGPRGAVAPDLSRVGQTFTPRDLLAAILHPSETIQEPHQVRRFELKDGRAVEGIVVAATEESRLVLVDPARPNQTETVLVAELLAEKVSGISAMPKGLLDEFREDDVLDLLAYLLSGGDERDAMFRK
jgi:putative heme-binding domain-containing protein